MTIAKGLSSGYQPIGGSIVCDEVAEVVGGAGEFFHGYTYSGHPVACSGGAGEPADHAGRKDRRARP
jgi:putrescine---pyruvate transaminase